MEPRPPVSWVLDTYLTDRTRGITGFPTLAEACAELGYPVYQTRWVPGSEAPDPGIPFGPGAVVTYGTHQFVAQVMAARGGQWRPGAFGRIERHGYEAFGPHLRDVMLNPEYRVLPFREAVRHGFEAFGEACFVKPESVTKAFPGTLLRRDEADARIAKLREKHDFPDDLPCVVAAPVDIEAEFRFVVADGEVVTGSQYRWGDRPDVRIDVMPVCLDMAREVARRPWQADRCYVVDVALVDGRSAAKVIELNTFSSSGLYAMDTRAIVEAVSRSALRVMADSLR